MGQLLHIFKATVIFQYTQIGVWEIFAEADITTVGAGWRDLKVNQATFIDEVPPSR